MSAEQPTPTRAGAIVFAMLFLGLALFLISQLGAETKFSARGKLFAQPAFWPAVSVIGMLVFGAFHLLGVILQRKHSAQAVAPGVADLLGETGFWLRSFEFFAWFMLYVWITPKIGYLPATLLFTTLLAWRAGYRQRRTLILAAATGVVIVVLFKTLLAVKIPGGAIYESLPPALRTFMIINF